MSFRLCVNNRGLVPRPCVLVTLSVALGFSVCGEKPISAQPPPTRPLGQEFPVYRPSPDDPGRPEGPAFEVPSGTISLRDAVALALLYSPELAAYAWETRAREARVLQAGAVPNPVVSVLVEDIGASGFLIGATTQQLVQPQATVQLSQVIELGGKRGARQDLASLNRDLAAWDYETARIDILTQVTHAFIDVLAAQETLALTEQTVRLVEQVQLSVGARVVAGVVSPIEQTRAEVSLAAVRVEYDRARRLLDASRHRLATTWGRVEATFQSAAGDMRDVSAPPPIDELRARVVESPELARWTAEILQRQASLAVERSKRVPDVAVTAGYRRFTEIDTNAFLVGLSTSLPLFDRNHGGIEEAGSRLAKAYEESRAAQARTSAVLAEAHRALSSAYDEVAALRSAVLPGSQQTFEAVTEGYRLGKFAYLDVLDAQRTLIGANGQHLRALSDYHKAVADVERLIGAPLHATAAPPSIDP